jgi:hypothetical protein
MKTVLSQIKTFNSKVLVIDGITRSGKFWLMNFLHHLRGVEHACHEPVLDHIIVAAKFGLMDEGTAIGLIQGVIDRSVYKTKIGRDLNCKISDSSSVLNRPDLAEYLQRMLSPAKGVAELIRVGAETQAWFPFITHDVLSQEDFIFRALPNGMVVRVNRHPVDLVYAWYKKGLGRSDMQFDIRIDRNGVSVPWFCAGFLDGFNAASEMDRIILSINFLISSSEEACAKLKQELESRIYHTSYERLGSQPTVEINKIASFLGVEVRETFNSFVLDDIFKTREIISIKRARLNKMTFIKSIATREAFLKLVAMADRYKFD